MESTFKFRPCSHHRHLYHHHHHPCCHHHHHHPCCHHRHHHHHCNCHHLCPRIASLSLHPQSNYYSASQIDLNLQPNFYKETPASVAQISEEPKQNELDNEDEDEDDPIFVLTDEWREYFAKSEAKRKLDKQLAKKKNRQS
ncbi:uncharacterized protein [Euphorbia lathyris]|uniref:uncharacterized protein n=1 Tax=Euphorbia lathyris TaxID=212925 RepID=UPI0033135EA7